MHWKCVGRGLCVISFHRLRNYIPHGDGVSFRRLWQPLFRRGKERRNVCVRSQSMRTVRPHRNRGVCRACSSEWGHSELLCRGRGSKVTCLLSGKPLSNTQVCRGLGLFGVAGETCLFKQFKHSVEFLGETAYHMWQLVEGWW